MNSSLTQEKSNATATHTPGEWTFLPRPMSKTVGSVPQYVITGNDGRALETVAIAYGLANARLIAAAPELLTVSIKEEENFDDAAHGRPLRHNQFALNSERRAVIAKATNA